jgi:hypothetical protein
MTRLNRIRRRQRDRERHEQAQLFADATGQAQVAVRDRANGETRILPHAIRSSQPGGKVYYPRGNNDTR